MMFIQLSSVPYIKSHGMNSFDNDCKNSLGKQFYNMYQVPLESSYPLRQS